MITYNGDDLKKASIYDMFLTKDCDDFSEAKWRRIVLRKSKKNVWEILDESGTKLLEQVK